MKTSEKIIDEIQSECSMGSFEYLGFEDCKRAMKEYAREVCKEQRKLCEKAWLDENINNSSNHVKMMAIRNAPEPELD